MSGPLVGRGVVGAGVGRGVVGAGVGLGVGANVLFSSDNS